MRTRRSRKRRWLPDRSVHVRDHVHGHVLRAHVHDRVRVRGSGDALAG